MSLVRPASDVFRGQRGAVVAAAVLLCAGGGGSGASLPAAPDLAPEEFCRTTPGLRQQFLDRHAARAADLPAPPVFPAGSTLAAAGSTPFIDTGQFENGSVVDMGGVIVLVDDDRGIFGTPFNASGLRLDIVQLSKAYYSARPDDTETLAFFPNFNHGDGTFQTLIQNSVAGINRQEINDAALYGSAGRLESVLVFADFNQKPLDPAERFTADHNTHLSLVAHEWTHRFGAFVLFEKGGEPSTELLGRQFAHWCFFHDTRAAFFPSGMSALEGNRWAQDFTGEWVTQGATNGYSPLDLYLMGLFAPQEVPPFFYIDGPRLQFDCSSGPVSSPPQTPVKVPGVQRIVTIDAVLAVHGLRDPDHTQSPKNFRMTFLLLTRRGRFPSPAEVAQLERLRQEWEPYFSVATGGRATMDTSSGPPPGPAATFAVVRLPDDVQAGHPFRFAVLALDADGRVATGYDGTVRFSSADDPEAVLPGDMTFTPADRGYVAVPEPLTFSRGGSLSITVSDVADGSITATRTRLGVEPPALTLCAPAAPDPSESTTRPWGIGPSFAGAQGVRFQYLIHRDRIGRPGLITSLNWDVADGPDRVEWGNVSVKLAHKPDFALLSSTIVPSPLDQNLLDSLSVTQVLGGSLSRSGLVDSRRLHFRLTTLFPYNGIDHLLVDIHYTGGVPPGLKTDKVLGGPEFLTVEKLGPNLPVPRFETSTICLDIRLPSGVLPTATGLEIESVGNTTARVGWRTSPSTTARVLYGEAGSPLDRSTGVQRFDVVHSIDITGLLPGTQYEAMTESRDVDDQVVLDGPITFMTTEFRPSINSLTPKTLPQGTPNTLVRVRGEHFFPGLSVQIVDADVPATGPPSPDPAVRIVAFNRLSETVIDLGVVIDSDAPPGPRRVHVANSDGFDTVSSIFFGVEPPVGAVDIDTSGRVDGFDLARLARAFGATFPDPRYDVAADLDGDGDVDGFDLTRLADRFGS